MVAAVMRKPMMIRRIGAAVVVAVVWFGGVVVTATPAEAANRTFTNSATSRYDVRGWNGYGCTSSKRDFRPGESAANWVRSYRIYSPYARVKWHNQLYIRVSGACYNTPTIDPLIAYAKP